MKTRKLVPPKREYLISTAAVYHAAPLAENMLPVFPTPLTKKVDSKTKLCPRPAPKSQASQH